MAYEPHLLSISEPGSYPSEFEPWSDEFTVV